MKIIKLFEVASSDGYKSSGDGELHLSSTNAYQSARNRHKGYAAMPIEHDAIEAEDGRYLLLKSTNPVSVVGTAQAVEDIAKAALEKLTSAERAALGLNHRSYAARREGLTMNTNTDGVSAMSAELGAVLTYTTSGHSRPCGQTMGANGAGDFALLIYGKPHEAEAAARAHIRELEAGGYKIKTATLVPNQECYSGPQIRTLQAHNTEVVRPEGCERTQS